MNFKCLSVGVAKSRVSTLMGASLLILFVGSSDALAEYADEQYASLRRSPLLSVRARNVTQILTQLMELKRRFANGEEVDLPIVAVTAAGKTHVGVVYDLSSAAEREPCVLMETKETEGTRMSGARLCFIRLSEIDSVEIRDAWTNSVQSNMGYGSFENISPPTKLDLKRKMANFSTWLSEKSGKEITYNMDLTTVPVGGASLRSIAAVMSETTGELCELLANESTRQKLRKELKGVNFVVEKQSDARLDHGMVTVAINLSLKEDRSRREFGSKIRALFDLEKSL